MSLMQNDINSILCLEGLNFCSAGLLVYDILAVLIYRN